MDSLLLRMDAGVCVEAPGDGMLLSELFSKVSEDDRGGCWLAVASVGVLMVGEVGMEERCSCSSVTDAWWLFWKRSWISVRVLSPASSSDDSDGFSRIFPVVGDEEGELGRLGMGVRGGSRCIRSLCTSCADAIRGGTSFGGRSFGGTSFGGTSFGGTSFGGGGGGGGDLICSSSGFGSSFGGVVGRSRGSGLDLRGDTDNSSA